MKILRNREAKSITCMVHIYTVHHALYETVPQQESRGIKVHKQLLTEQLRLLYNIPYIWYIYHIPYWIISAVPGQPRVF